MTMFLTIFIPAYNEEANLEHCIAALESSLAHLEVLYEILIVDDASHDQTGAIAENKAQLDSRVRVVHHSQNLGIGGGFCTAVAQARGDWLLLIPADLALDPADLHLYIEAAANADIVVGLRSNRNDYSFFRKLVSWTNIHLIQLLFGMELHQFQYISMYRLNVLRAMNIEYWRSAFFLPEVLIKAKTLGKRLVEVEIRYLPRLTGAATGVNGRVILRTVRDMFHFWLRRVIFGVKGVKHEQVN